MTWYRRTCVHKLSGAPERFDLFAQANSHLNFEAGKAYTDRRGYPTLGGLLISNPGSRVNWGEHTKWGRLERVENHLRAVDHLSLARDEVTRRYVSVMQPYAQDSCEEPRGRCTCLWKLRSHVEEVNAAHGKAEKLIVYSFGSSYGWYTAHAYLVIVVSDLVVINKPEIMNPSAR